MHFTDDKMKSNIDFVLNLSTDTFQLSNKNENISIKYFHSIRECIGYVFFNALQDEQSCYFIILMNLLASLRVLCTQFTKIELIYEHFHDCFSSE